jgi:hypothetical protein
VRRDEDLAGQLSQPIACNLVDYRRCKRIAVEADLHEERVAYELGVPLPFKAERPEIPEEVRHPGVRRRNSVALA